MRTASSFMRMPTLAEVIPAARDLAYLVDVAGGLEIAAQMTGTTPALLVEWMTGRPYAPLALATRRLAGALAARVGWTFELSDPFDVRAVA